MDFVVVCGGVSGIKTIARFRPFGREAAGDFVDDLRVVIWAGQHVIIMEHTYTRAARGIFLSVMMKKRSKEQVEGVETYIHGVSMADISLWRAKATRSCGTS